MALLILPITGLAGKYRQGIGTPFDLQDLTDKDEVRYCLVNLDHIAYIKVIDITGDGSCCDHRSEELKAQWGENAPIYDPYPTEISAGFDLEALGVRYQNITPVFEICPDGEICGDKIDNDQDGLVDEGCFSYYRDADGDGYGNPNIIIYRCGCQEGYVLNNNDCNDCNCEVNPGNLGIRNGMGEVVEDFEIGPNIMEPTCPLESSFALLRASQADNKTLTIHRKHSSSKIVESSYWFFNKVCGVNFPISPQIRHKVFRGK